MATPEDLATTVKQVEALDRRIIASEVDVRDLAALTAAVDDGVAQLGRLDIVLANAGISTPAPTLEMDEQVWDEMIEINLTGQWKTIRAAVPHIINGGRGGSVVITSSLAAIYANANTAHYSAAKAGLVMLMKVLAKELAPQSIRVNSIHPTTVATDMILNEPTYRLFRPDLEHPTREDFEVAARTLNKLPVAAMSGRHLQRDPLPGQRRGAVRHRHHPRRRRRRPARLTTDPPAEHDWKEGTSWECLRQGRPDPGGSRGQGRAHAVTSAREGADVIIVDIADQMATVPYKMATPDDLEENGQAGRGVRPAGAGDHGRRAVAAAVTALPPLPPPAGWGWLGWLRTAGPAIYRRRQRPGACPRSIAGTRGGGEGE